MPGGSDTRSYIATTNSAIHGSIELLNLSRRSLAEGAETFAEQRSCAAAARALLARLHPHREPPSRAEESPAPTPAAFPIRNDEVVAGEGLEPPTLGL